MKLKEKTDVNKNFTKLTHKRGISLICLLYTSYNDPLGYADLILNGDLEEYLGTVISVHGFGD